MRTRDVIGTAFEPVRFRPETRLSVPLYARALGLDDPVLLSTAAASEAGLASRPVPAAMFGFFLAVPADDLVEGLGFTWGRTLNVGITVTSRQTVLEHELVEGRASVVDAWERLGSDGGTRQFLVLQADFSVEGGLACRWRVTFIERKDGPPDDDVTDGPSADTTASDELPSARQDAPGPRPGQRLDPLTTGDLTRLDLARLSAALDNPDPLHLDDEVARDAGFPQVVGQGSAVVGLLEAACRTATGWVAPLHLDTRQRAPFTVGDRLTVAGEVLDDGRSAKISVTDAADAEVASATARWS